MKRYIRSYSNDGQGYWYHARHGIGPGTIPNDVHLLDVVEDPENSWKDYILLDRVLTTDELKQYDLKEECPPQVDATTSVTCGTRKKQLNVPEIQYYDRMSPEAEEESFSYIDDQTLADMGYEGYHILGWYEMKPEYDDIFNGAGELSDVMLIDGGDGTFLGYIVGDRVYRIEEDEITDHIQDLMNL